MEILPQMILGSGFLSGSTLTFGADQASGGGWQQGCRVYYKVFKAPLVCTPDARSTPSPAVMKMSPDWPDTPG